MEQMRKKNEFMGERSRSLPTSRWQSDERIQTGTAVGFWQLSEKLSALRSSKEVLPDEGEDLKPETMKDVLSDPPLTSLAQRFKTETQTSNNDYASDLIKKPVPLPKPRTTNEEVASPPPVSPVQSSGVESSSLTRRNSLVVKRNRSKVIPLLFQRVYKNAITTFGIQSK